MNRAEALKKLRTFAGALRARGATSLYLSGSTAKDKAGAKSDLDLFIDYDPRGKFNAFDLVASKRLLQEGLGVDVDLTTRKGLHPLIRKRVEAEATRVFLMPARSPLLRIHDMLESIRGIEKAIAGRNFRDFERSWVLRSAIERGIEVISEASRHLGRELKSQHKDVRWKDIAGIGNIQRHEYQRVDSQIIWNAVKGDLPALKKALLAIKASLKD